MHVLGVRDCIKLTSFSVPSTKTYEVFKSLKILVSKFSTIEAKREPVEHPALITITNSSSLLLLLLRAFQCIRAQSLLLLEALNIATKKCIIPQLQWVKHGSCNLNIHIVIATALMVFSLASN